MEKAKSAEDYIKNHPLWSEELIILRELVLKTELEETLKWGMPVYTLDNKNVVGITGFKKFFGLWFYQGCFLSDPHKLLRNAQEGKTKAMRHLNFMSKKEIKKSIVNAYVKEAIANQKAGKVVKAERKKILLPPELKELLDGSKEVATAFAKFTTSNQNDFKNYIAGAKQEATKQRRIDKIIPMILRGEGMNDKYRK